MDNINLIFPELFISLSIMFLLLVGVFKKDSSKLVYNFSAVFLFITIVLIFNNKLSSDISLFKNSYIIDYLSSFMKVITLLGGIFILLISSRYLKIFKLFQIE